MTAINDLQTEMASLVSNVSNEIAAIAAKLDSAQTDDPIVVDAVAKLKDVNARLTAETAALTPAADAPVDPTPTSDNPLGS